MDKKTISEAAGKYGYETVNSIIEMVDINGANRAYRELTEKGMLREAECLMMLYSAGMD